MDEPARPASPTAPAAPKKRRRKGLPWWASTAVLLAVVAGLGGLVYYAYQPKNGVHADRLKADADRDLPPWSGRDDVKGWLSARGIEYSDLRDAGGQKVGYAATVPNDSWMEPAEIVMLFRHDGDGLLNDTTIYRSVKR